MLHLPPPVPAAVYTGWRLGGWLHQPRVEPNRTDDTVFDTMAFPPTKTGLRTFP